MRMRGDVTNIPSLLFFPFFQLSLILVVAHPRPPETLVLIGPLKLLTFHFLAESNPVIELPGPAAGPDRDHRHQGYKINDLHFGTLL